MSGSRTRTALCLLSGGLDSQLAVCVLRNAGVAVKGVAFTSPFFDSSSAERAATQLKIPLLLVDFTSDILKLLEHAKHGFGSEMNPCIDCHTRMIQRAGEMLAEAGCDFIATGEVLNERPMSQVRRSLDSVAAESGFAELLLRPLSAKLLPETLPEREGWIDRMLLMDLEGRSRKRQFKMAKEYGLAWYPTPAGGCKLTEPNFCIRLKELKAHEGLTDIRLIQLLKKGRHFRMGPRVRLLVGRDSPDNEALEKAVQPGDVLLRMVDIPGPVGLLIGSMEEQMVLRSASICAAYSDVGAGCDVKICIVMDGVEREISVQPLNKEETLAMRI